MKSTFLNEIIDQTSIEVKATRQQTIDRLMALSGFLRDKDSNDSCLLFDCDKKGRISIDYPHRRRQADFRIYYVEGEVTEKDGRTVVNIYSIHSRFTSFLMMFFAVAVALMLAITVYITTATKGNILPGGEELLTLALGSLLVFWEIACVARQKKNKARDLELMKKAVTDRITAVERWDD